MMIDVTVVIPTHNSGKYLTEALESVFSQTFNNYEIIIVDDGSTDNTREIANQFKSNPRLHYLYQKQRGPSTARNTGIKASKGKFIAFLDADDLWLPSKLEKQLKIFNLHDNVEMVFTENSFFDMDGIFKEKLGKKYLMKGNLAQNILLYSGIATPTVIVRSDVFDTLGLFETSLNFAEDDNMWIRIASHYNVKFIDESLTMVRDHSSRLTRNNNKTLAGSLINIQYLCSKYGEKVENTIRPVLKTKKAMIYFDQGYLCFEKESITHAKRLFLKATKNKLFTPRAWIYFILCFLPISLQRLLKSIKQQLGKTNPTKNKWTRS